MQEFSICRIHNESQAGVITGLFFLIAGDFRDERAAVTFVLGGYLSPGLDVTVYLCAATHLTGNSTELIAGAREALELSRVLE